MKRFMMILMLTGHLIAVCFADEYRYSLNSTQINLPYPYDFCLTQENTLVCYSLINESNHLYIKKFTADRSGNISPLDTLAILPAAPPSRMDLSQNGNRILINYNNELSIVLENDSLLYVNTQESYSCYLWGNYLISDNYPGFTLYDLTTQQTTTITENSDLKFSPLGNEYIIIESSINDGTATRKLMNSELQIISTEQVNPCFLWLGLDSSNYRQQVGTNYFLGAPDILLRSGYYIYQMFVTNSHLTMYGIDGADEYGYVPSFLRDFYVSPDGYISSLGGIMSHSDTLTYRYLSDNAVISIPVNFPYDNVQWARKYLNKWIMFQENSPDNRLLLFDMSINFLDTLTVSTGLFRATAAEQTLYCLAQNTLYIVTVDSMVAENDIVEPSSQVVLENYPNPFRDGTNFRASAKSSGNFKMQVCNIKGQVVWEKVCFGSDLEKSFYWNAVDKKGKKLPSGVYLASLIGEDYQAHKKMILIK